MLNIAPLPVQQLTPLVTEVIQSDTSITASLFEVIGAGVSESHTRVFNWDFSWYIYLSFRKSRDNLLTQNIAQAEY